MSRSTFPILDLQAPAPDLQPQDRRHPSKRRVPHHPVRGGRWAWCLSARGRSMKAGVRFGRASGKGSPCRPEPPGTAVPLKEGKVSRSPRRAPPRRGIDPRGRIRRVRRGGAQGRRVRSRRRTLVPGQAPGPGSQLGRARPGPPRPRKPPGPHSRFSADGGRAR